MSAISCPVCQGSFREVLREGILIDVCTQCRGVWLDRGELEKLLSLAGGTASVAAPQPQPQPYQAAPPQYYEKRRDYDDDDDHKRYGSDKYAQDKYGRPVKKKKGFDLGDIFDFGD